jgi:hypothetical protein
MTSSREESMTASAPMASAVSQAPGNDVGHSYLFDAAQLQPDGGSEPDGPGREHHDLVCGPGLAAVDAVPRDRHTLVERGDVVGHRPGDHRQALAHDGVLDDQVLSHGAQRAAAADDAGGAACGLTTIRSPGFRPVTPAPDRHPRDAHAAEIQRPGREGAARPDHRGAHSDATEPADQGGGGSQLVFRGRSAALSARPIHEPGTYRPILGTGWMGSCRLTASATQPVSGR